LEIKGYSRWCLVAVALVSVIIACSPGTAADPVLPHIFYGNVTINMISAPPGTQITAEVGGVVREDDVTAAEGFYGSTQLTGDKFEVQGEIENGEAITFFVNGIQAEVYDVGHGGPWTSSYPFNSGATTHLNLSILGPTTYTISAIAGPGGSISPSGNVLVIEGTDKTFTMIPDVGYRVDQILVDGDPVAATPVYTFMNVTKDHTITVSFIEGPPDYFTVVLGDDWNLFSTPVKLASGHQNLEDIFSDSLDDVDVILAWDGSQWFIPGYGYELKPLYAVYVKVEGSATAVIYPSSTVSSPPVRNLNAGLNLIGPAPAYDSGGFPSMPVEEALVSIYTVQGGLTGYTIVVSPGLNQPGWAYARDGSSEDVLPYKGYWVVMENPGAYAGFSTTPI
jgi:hypothetical protein